MIATRNQISRKAKMTYYKFLTETNKGACSEFDYSDYLPKGGRPGKWIPKVKDVAMCESGYHACEKRDLMNWANAQLFEVELRGGIVDGDSKTVGQQMRFIRKVDGWNERNLRLAACEIAEKTVKKYWNDPDDTRPMDAIKVARRYAHGKATEDELVAAKSSSASSASSSAWWSALVAWSAASASASSTSAPRRIIFRHCGLTPY
jgi:hypothetical protein